MERIYSSLKSKVMSAEDAALLIKAGMTLGCSGFTVVGHPKAVPLALAKQGTAKDLTLMTGASVGDVLDGELVRSGLVSRRYPYQANASMRSAINAGQVQYVDMHLSHMPAYIARGGRKIDYAVIECAAVTPEGIVLTASVGASDCFVRHADRVILEINTAVPAEIYGLHDIYYSDGGPIPVKAPGERVGSKVVPCPEEKIAAVVFTEDKGKAPTFKPADDISAAISRNIVDFLHNEVAGGRLGENLAPIQSGVGSVANAVLKGLSDSGFENLTMYTEVLQDSALELVKSGKVTAASSTAISLSEQMQAEFYGDLDYYKERIVLRGQEMSNSPEVARRLGLISMNTPIECDIYGNVNSTHILGSRLMNGIGGSGDFARNAGLTIFATPSTAKDGNISCIVPMVSHVDHTEHDVMVIATEYGIADLRWKSPKERAEEIIGKCAHPDYRDALRDYFERACRESGGAQTPHILMEALSWHQRCKETGSMK